MSLTPYEIRPIKLQSAITREQCDTGCKLVLNTNKKLHMGFRLVAKSVILNDLERCNSPYFCVILPNSVAFWTGYVKELKIDLYCL